MSEKLKLLLSTSSELAKERDLKKILIKLTNLAKDIINADRCSIFLYDKDKRELCTIVAHGVQEIRMPENKGIVGDVFQRARTLNIKNAYEDPRFEKEIDKKTGYHTKNILAVPLLNRAQESIGTFQVINKLDASSFSYEDQDLLRHIALYASSTIENALLYEKLKKAHEDVIYRLSHVTKFKDPETQEHIIRVGLFCGVLANELGWEEDEVENIKLAAPMHDIGKVGIPDKILLKPGKLEEEEWEEMKRHTIYGYEILKNEDTEILHIASVVALEHHEKWNGSGYPHAKKGEEISIHGRMTALADVFDALSSNRPYKKMWKTDEIIDYINQRKSIEFDPTLADIFLKKMDEILKIKETLPN